MSKNIWLQKKPQSVLDWLGIIFCSIGFYILLGHLNLFVGAVGKVLNILAPFATGIVIAYVLDCIVRPVHHKLLKDNPKMRWLAILIAYVAAVLIIFVLGWMVIPQVISSIVILFENLPSYFNNVQSLLLTIQENYGLDVSKAVTALDDYEQLMNELGNLLAGAVPKIVASPPMWWISSRPSPPAFICWPRRTSCCASCASWPAPFCPVRWPRWFWIPSPSPTRTLRVSSSAKLSIPASSAC